MAGMWRQHETSDGTYGLEDLLDAHELLDIKAETDRRWNEWHRIQRGGE
jgi:hypothetical protein